MESKYKNIQVYCVWVNGRDAEDVDQHFPIVLKNNDYLWHTNLKKAVDYFYKIKIKDSDSEEGFYTDIYQDFHVALYSIDIDINEFENQYDLDFNLDDDNVQEMIPYYVNYDLNVVAERVSKFINK